MEQAGGVLTARLQRGGCQPEPVRFYGAVLAKRLIVDILAKIKNGEQLPLTGIVKGTVFATVEFLKQALQIDLVS